MAPSFRLCLGAIGWFCAALPVPLSAAELHLSAVTVDITPDEPVALDGQRNVRISKTPATRIYAAALALEAREGDRVLDQAIMVSCDLVAIRQGILATVRENLAGRMPGFDLYKLFLSATHTHTAPGRRTASTRCRRPALCSPANTRYG